MKVQLNPTAGTACFRSVLAGIRDMIRGWTICQNLRNSWLVIEFAFQTGTGTRTLHVSLRSIHNSLWRRLI